MLVLHHEDQISPSQVCRSNGLLGGTRRSPRSNLHSRIITVDRFRRWATPLILAANEQDLDSISHVEFLKGRISRRIDCGIPGVCLALFQIV